MTIVEKFEQNIDQVNSDFQAIKSKIVECGVEVPDGTKTSELTEKVEGVYEAGKQAEYNAFWDDYLAYAKRTGDGQGLFYGKGWNETTLNLPYPIDFLTQASNLFGATENLPKEKLAMVDYSKFTRFYNTFNTTRTVEIPEIDTRGASELIQIFAWSTMLITIDKLILKDDGSQTFNDLFRGTTALINLEIEGKIGQNGFDVSHCRQLSKDSIYSIINALSTTTAGLTVTFSKTAVDTAFELAEGDGGGSYEEDWLDLVATKPNWTISLA